MLAAHGGAGGVRNVGLLESAVVAPQATSGGEPPIGDPTEIAAAYLFYLRRNHPFVDGNKRTALAACLVFLEQNRLLPDSGALGKSIDDWETRAPDVAASRLDRAATSKRLRRLLPRRKPVRMKNAGRRASPGAGRKSRDR